MTYTDRETFSALLDDFEALFNRTLRPGVATQYFDALKAFSVPVVSEAARELKLKVSRFPSIAEWVEACKAAAGRRARANPQRESAEQETPFTWTTCANRVLLFAALAGVRVDDEAVRDRLLATIHDELITLREDYATPRDCPPALWRSERSRIVAVVLEQVRRGEPASADVCTSAQTTAPRAGLDR